MDGEKLVKNVLGIALVLIPLYHIIEKSETARPERPRARKARDPRELPDRYTVIETTVDTKEVIK